MDKIKLGYAIGSGKEVFVTPSHLIVTGITQQSGKTTTLEALIYRSNLKAIVFKTKPGEKSFTTGTVVPPFFRDRSDYEFVRSLIEAYSKEKMNIEKGTLMTLCKGSTTLLEIKKRVDDAMAAKKLRGIMLEIYTRLQHYLENLIPQVQYANFSSVLSIVNGVNIMDLERFTPEAQSLIIRSVADEVLKTSRDTIIVIPEAWKFIPQRLNNPCKHAVESYVRQGAANNNFIWIDSQDMAGVDKIPLKQISTWILGFQSERNEVKHTLDQISLPPKKKPTEEDVMKLSVGQFILSSREQVVKVYVQPTWLSDDQAWKIATGKADVRDAISSKPIRALNIPGPPTHAGSQYPDHGSGFATKKELTEMRIDFFNKIDQFVEQVNNFIQNMQPSTGTQQIDEQHIVSLVLQKIPQQKALNAGAAVNVDDVIKEVLKRLPQQQGGVAVYNVSPLEKIKKDFLQEMVDAILDDIKGLNENERKLLKYMETRDKDVAPAEAITKCFLWAPGGGASSRVSVIFSGLFKKGFVEKTPGSRYRKALKDKIESLMGNHNATAEEKANVYDHILAGLI